MQGLLYEESSAWLFLLVTVVMGGWAAWRAGRALAGGWRPLWQVVPAVLALGVAVRFIHFSLFEGTMFSGRYYLVDTAIVLAFALLGFRAKRAEQMTRQYRWLYEPAGSLAWRRRGA